MPNKPSSINVLIGSDDLGRALDRYLKAAISPVQISILHMGRPLFLSQDILNADLWIAQAFNPNQPENPEGFRTALKLAGSKRFLILFSAFSPITFPKEGFFWTTYNSSKPLFLKIQEVINAAVPTYEDYQALIKIWPDLAYDPSYHAHNTNTIRGRDL